MQTRKNRKVFWVVVIAVVITVEMVFDIFEIVMGKYLLVINPMRPQIGRLWEEEQKDILAEEETLLVEVLDADSLYQNLIPNFNELLKLLDMQNVIVLDKSNFLDFYKRIDEGLAQTIVDPLTVYDLDRQNNWRSVKINKSGNLLNFYFLDGFNQPLNESFLNLKNIQSFNGDNKSALNKEPMFVGRIISANDFFLAFDQLSRSYRLQIFNNPYRLIQIKDDLARVGISRYSENGSVEMAFEVNAGNSQSVFRMNAAEIAVGYLLSALNETGDFDITLPAKKEEESE
jgi:hypothetical protein